MLDDAAYVEAYIAEKLCGEPVGRKKIHYDLARKGIGEELLNRVDAVSYTHLDVYKRQVQHHTGNG